MADHFSCQAWLTSACCLAKATHLMSSTLKVFQLRQQEGSSLKVQPPSDGLRC